MTGPLLHPTAVGLSPEGALPHGSARPLRPSIRTSPGVPLAPPTRLRRFFGRWVAAAHAYRERQAELLASHRAGDQKLNEKRIYRGPIDDALEKAARLRQRRRLRRS